MATLKMSLLSNVKKSPPPQKKKKKHQFTIFSESLPWCFISLILVHNFEVQVVNWPIIPDTNSQPGPQIILSPIKYA